MQVHRYRYKLFKTIIRNNHYFKLELIKGGELEKTTDQTILNHVYETLLF